MNIISLFYLEIKVFLSSIPQNLLWIPTENLTGIPLGSDGIPVGYHPTGGIKFIPVG